MKAVVRPLLLWLLFVACAAVAQDLQPVSPNAIPETGSFYRMQRQTAPLPFNPFPDLPVYVLDWSRNIFLVDDRSVNYEQLFQERMAQAQTDGAEDEGGPVPPPYDYPTNVLWIEILGVTNDLAYLTVHNTRSNYYYQLQSKVDLNQPEWTLGQWLPNETGSNQLYFDPVPVGGRTNQFFRARESPDLVFRGLTIADTGQAVPDSMGAVGLNHFVELLNNGIAVYDKYGGLVTQTNSTNFFAVFDASGTNSLTGDVMIDPRILYDSQSDRWIACAIDLNKTRDVVLAISNSGSPTNLATGWTNHLLQVHRDGPDTDFTTLGLDSNGIYVRVLHRWFSTNVGHTIVAIHKSNIYGGNLVATNFSLNEDFDRTLRTIQPVVNFDAVATNGYAWFVAKGPPDLGASYQGGEIYYRRLQWVGTNAGWVDASWCAVSNAGPNYRNYYDLDGTNITSSPTTGVIAEALGGNVNLYNVGSRLAMPVIRNGFLWTCHAIGLNDTNGIYTGNKFGTNVNRSGIQWFKLQINTNGAALALSDHGRVFDSIHETNAWWYHFPSLAVNGLGNMVAGFSGSSATSYIGAFYTWRLAGGPMLDPPRLLQPGTIAYSGEWGDYSATTLDPTDDWSFWTVQAYAAPWEPYHVGRWATVITKIRPLP